LVVLASLISWTKTNEVPLYLNLESFVVRISPAVKSVEPSSFLRFLRPAPLIFTVKAEGYAVFTGVATTPIPTGTEIQKADGTQYETQSLGTISTQTIGLFSLTRSGSTATATTSSNHNLATGLSVTIAGAGQAEYNITATITVISNTQFTYTVSGTPASPATGTITASSTNAYVAIKATEYGVAGNSIGG